MMETEIEPLPDRGFNMISDQKVSEAESQLTFLRLKMQLLAKESEEKYDEVIHHINIHRRLILFDSELQEGMQHSFRANF